MSRVTCVCGGRMDMPISHAQGCPHLRYGDEPEPLAPGSIKPLVLFHGSCRDGFCAAWVAKRALGDIEAVEVFYGTPPPDVTGRDVYVLDFSYPRPQMEQMAAAARSLCVLDHHRTAAEALAGLSYVTFDMERSGAGLTWDHFFRGVERPWLVDYVEDRDLWRKRLPDSDAVNAFISTLPYAFEAWDQQDTPVPGNVGQLGLVVLARTKQYVAEIAKNAIRFRFEGFDVPLVNAPQMDISDLLAHLAQGEPFAMGWFQRADGKFQYSLRSRAEGVDVAELARRYGGGGHAQAAGFEAGWPIHLGLFVKPLVAVVGGQGIIVGDRDE